MFNVIPLVVIALSLSVIIFIILRKLPQVSNLDVDNLPEEKEARKKRDIINQRVEERGRRLWKIWRTRLEPLRGIWGQMQLRFRIYVGRVERLWYHEQSIKKRKKSSPLYNQEREITALIQEAEQYLKAGNYDKAEEAYISAVKIDTRCAAAYRGLGDAYLAKGSWEEARETYRFLLQLEPDDDGAMVKLAEIAEKQGDLEEAIGYYQSAVLVNDSLSSRFYRMAELLLKVKQPAIAREAIVQAVELDPKSPKYLDLLVEIAIICGDKDLAARGYNELRSVNPENHKLEEFKDRISKM